MTRAERIRALYERDPDLTPSVIAERLGTHPDYVSRVLREAGRPRSRAARATEVLRVRREHPHLRSAEIARMVGAHVVSVRRILRRHGLAVPTGRPRKGLAS